MKILVDVKSCVGHARCNKVAPELFPLDDNGYNVTASEVEIPAGDEALAQRAVRACPERVMRIAED